MAQARNNQIANQPLELSSFPAELLMRICEQLIPEDIMLIFLLVSKNFNQIARDEQLWQKKFNLHFQFALEEIYKDKNDKIFDWLGLFKNEWIKRVQYLQIPHIGRLFSVITEGDYESFKKLPRYDHTVFFQQDNNGVICSDLAVKSGNSKILKHLYFRVYRPAAEFQKVLASDSFYVHFTKATFSETSLYHQNGWTLLYLAIANGISLAKIKRLLKNGNQFNERWELDEAQPIHVAAKFGRLDVIKYLIKNYAVHLEEQDKSGNTPLHYAVRFKQKKVVEYLIGKEVNIEAKNSEGYTPIAYTLMIDDCYSLLRYLLKQGANHVVSTNIFSQGEKEDLSILCILASSKNESVKTIIGEIVKEHPDIIQWRSVKRLNALDYSIMCNTLNVVKLLLANKSSFNEKVLLLAAEKSDIGIADNDENIFSYFYQYEPTLLDQVDESGNTILHVAIIKDNYATANAILQVRPDLATRKNNAGKTPLHIAAEEDGFMLEKCPGLMAEVGGDPKYKLDIFKIALANRIYSRSDKAKKLIDSFLKQDPTIVFRAFIAYDDLTKAAYDELFKYGENLEIAFRLLLNNGQLLISAGQLEYFYQIAFDKARIDKDSSDAEFSERDRLLKLLKKYPQLKACPVDNNLNIIEYAFDNSKFKFLKKLIKNGIISSEDKGNGGSTLLLMALARQDVQGREVIELAKSLVEYGANIHAKNSDGKTPIELCKHDPFIQAYLFGGDEGYSLVNESDLKLSYGVGIHRMISPLMIAVKDSQMAGIDVRFNTLLQNAVLDKQKKALIQPFVDYLVNRYHNPSEYIRKFLFWQVGCGRTEKIHAVLAVIYTILNDGDLQELADNPKYKSALSNSRLGKTFTKCIKDIEVTNAAKESGFIQQQSKSNNF